MGEHDGRHPEHDAVAAVARGWFTGPAPEIGYSVEPMWFGFLGHLRGHGSRAIFTFDDPSRVLDALADVLTAAATTGSSAVIWVDDRRRAKALAPGLEAAGWLPGNATTHLALVGPVRTSAVPGELRVERIDPRRGAFDQWARVKIQCFDDAESAPSRERIDREIAVRQNEAPLANYLLASVEGEPVAVLGYYTGRDRLVFNLGTRVPFRHRGIAQRLLHLLSAEGDRDDCRSLMINATEGGQPEALYRRLGFSDEVYWYQAFDPAEG